LEDDQAQGLKKLARNAQEAAHKPESRQGTYARAQDELTRIHEQMADHSLQFAVSLYQMSVDLAELSDNTEKGRKQWKASGLAAEKRVSDAENQVEKAKAKYDTLAEQYDRVKTGDRQGGKFGLKGHKSAVQQEEELSRKVQNADSDYQAKVQAAKIARQELTSTHRPQTVFQLRQLIFECDSGVTLQLQKYGMFAISHQ
jgi:Rho GTPase-activating protein RGD1